MKLKALIVALIGVAVFLISTTIDAASGDLDVNGQLSVGEGGVKFPDGSIQTTAPTTSPTIENDVAASRALNTVYQNTTGKPLFVNVSVSVYIYGRCSAYADTSSTPAKRVAYFSNGSPNSSAAASLFFIVLPNHYYRVSAEGGPSGVNNWIEWH